MISDVFFLAGLTDALQLLKEIADSYDCVGYADLFQLASATGIQASPFESL